ncbi:phosphatase PAP2 family protein [Brevirhabdus sp.]|uniref:phosphatase PAP2 family protein n=1 Tax=Brevirhabdus sp. TaxID=2004514 RepID=UPI004058445F
MRAFLGFSLLYAAAGVVLVLLVRDSPAQTISRMFVTLPGMVGFFASNLIWLGVLGVALVIDAPAAEWGVRLRRALTALMGAGVMFVSFTAIKTSLPQILPFYADPFFARLDRVLHFGIDPWRLTHAFGVLPIAAVGLVYLKLWLFPAMFLPAILGLIDSDRARRQRFLILYVFVWIGLGNVVALLGMSAGPVYHDRLIGGSDFAALALALDQSGIAASGIGAMQEKLWDIYVSGGQAAGSGISAFPSVHVGMACVLALYLCERMPRAWPLAAMLVAAFQFLSVYQGWHYAVDGYASIVAVWVLWRLMRAYASARPRPAAQAALNARLPARHN